MARINQDETKCFWRGLVLHFMIALCVVFQVFDATSLAKDEETVQHYKMISTVEYVGQGQFRNQVVTIFTVTKEPLPDDKVRYSFATHDPNLGPSQESLMAFSFVIDRSTRNMSGTDKDLAFWTQVHNESVKSLDKVTKDYVGKTWKQSIDLSSLGGSPFDELRFTLTAIQLKTKAFGEMIAVRAMSEPFFVKIIKGSFRSRINTLYLFGPDVEDIYLSISVFEAATDVNDFKESLRHEVATCKTDVTGVPVDLSDVGENFEKLLAKVGLRSGSLEIVKESPLPQWASSRGLRAAQVANICSAVACEGALNPVATISMPAVKVLQSQRVTAGGAGASIFAIITRGFGWNLPTAAIISTATAVPIAITGGGGGGVHDASP